MKISIYKIKIPDNLMRRNMDERSIEHLARSMKAIGLMHPIGVREVDGEHELVHGHRRLSAAKMLEWDEINADVISATDEQVEMMRVMENREREEINAIDEGIYYQKVILERGWTQAYLAEMLQVSPGYVSQRVRSIEWPKSLRDAVEVGALSFSTAREISGIKDYEHLLYITKHAARNGATPTVAAEWRRKANLDHEEKMRREEGAPTEADVRKRDEGTMYCAACADVVLISDVSTIAICKECRVLISALKTEGTFKAVHEQLGATGEGEGEQTGQEGNG